MAGGRVIVITGATRGLGRALVQAFSAGGHRLAGCGRNPQHVADLISTFGPPHLFDALDVRNAQAVSTWAKRVLETLGIPDLLINNAAVINHPRVLWEIPAEEFDFLMDVNIKGVGNVLRSFLPAMVARKQGVIVNLSSGWGRSTSPEVAPYCASKFAIEGLTRALAEELPQGMAAVPLNPGVIATDMLKQVWGAEASAYPSAEQWAKRAAPFLLNLCAKDNGQPLTVP